MKKKVKLNKKQFQAFGLLNDYKTRHLLYGGAAEGGKSWLGCFWLQSMCMQFPQTRWFIGREELKRIHSSTFITFAKVAQEYGISGEFQYNGQYNFFKFANGSRVDLLELAYKPSDPLFERFGSTEYTGGFIEEGGEVPFGAYDVLSVRVGRHMNDLYGLLGKILITSNPKRNWLYTMFYQPWKNGKLPEDTAFVPALVDDNVFRESGSVEKLESIQNKSQRDRLRYGSWEYAEDPEQLISYEWIQQASQAEHVEGQNSLGVDVARFGDDETVDAEMNGNGLVRIEAFYQEGTNQTGQRVLQRIQDRDNPVSADRVGVDVVGLGAGVCDYLRSFDINVVEISGGSSPVEDESGYQYKNLRSQMWWWLAQSLKNGDIALLIEDQYIIQRLAEDLTSVRYRIRGDRVIEIESKEDIKKRLGRSPDYGDALVYVWSVDKIHTKDLIHLV